MIDSNCPKANGKAKEIKQTKTRKIPEDYKYISWVYGVDGKICQGGH